MSTLMVEDKADRQESVGLGMLNGSASKYVNDVVPWNCGIDLPASVKSVSLFIQFSSRITWPAGSRT